MLSAAGAAAGGGVLKTFVRAGNSILVRRAHTFQESDDDDDLIDGLGENDAWEKSFRAQYGYNAISFE